MPTSERVLSGSKSKGSRVTQEKEAVPFHQGLSVRSFDKTGDRLIPVGRSGDIFGIFKDNTRVGVSFFDDTIELNNTPEDIRGASGIIESKDIPSKFEKRLVFDQPFLMIELEATKIPYWQSMEPTIKSDISFKG